MSGLSRFFGRGERGPPGKGRGRGRGGGRGRNPGDRLSENPGDGPARPAVPGGPPWPERQAAAASRRLGWKSSGEEGGGGAGAHRLGSDGQCPGLSKTLVLSRARGNLRKGPSQSSYLIWEDKQKLAFTI